MTFEHRVQATRLLAMCLGLPCPGVPEGNSIIRLYFQGKVDGHNTDDLVIDFTSKSGETGTTRMQFKRSLSSALSNTAFREAVGLAWLDFSNPSFRRGRDVLAIAYLPPSAKAMEAAVEIASLAVASANSESWHRKVHAEGFSNPKNRTAFTSIAAAVSAYNKEIDISVSELHEFLIHLKFLQHDLDSDSTSEATSHKQTLAGLVGNEHAGLFWAKIIEICAELNGRGGDVDIDSIERYLGPELSEALKLSRTLQQTGNGLISFVREMKGKAPSVESSTTAYSVTASYPGQITTPNLDVGSDNKSLNKLVSRQLINIRDLQKKLRYREAMEQLDLLGEDQNDFDTYQRAFWHLLRGMCRWHWNNDPEGAAKDFIRSAEIDVSESKFAAAQIRGHLLRSEVELALLAAQKAEERFPAAADVALAAVNARLISGADISVGDIPIEHRNLAVSWELLAGYQEKSGNLVAAFQCALNAVRMPDATFFTRERLLRYALQDAAVADSFDGKWLLNGEQVKRLETALAEFDDKAGRLWIAHQSPTALGDVVVNLAYAHLLLGRPAFAIQLIREGEIHNVNYEDRDIRVDIDASCALLDVSAALARNEARLSRMPDDALVAYAQAAVDAMDFRRLEAATVIAQQRLDTADGFRLNETFKYLRWELWLKSGRPYALLADSNLQAITYDSTSIIDLVYAIRAHSSKKGDNRNEALVSRIAELMKLAKLPTEIYVGSQALYNYGRFAEAADGFERIAPENEITKIHEDLIDCLVRSGQLARANRKIGALPAGWEQSSAIRHSALELFQEVHDWVQVERLATIELDSSPSLTRSWLLRIIAAICNRSDSVESLVSKVPLDLEGDSQELARLAAIEFEYDQESKGLVRLYIMRRRQMSATEPAALHLKAIVSTNKSLTALDAVHQMVSPGTSVTVKGDDGTRRIWTIDPTVPLDLPYTDEFIAPTSENALRLLGKPIGEEIRIEDAYGTTKTLKVEKIVSAHRRLVELSHYSMRTTLTPSELLTSMQMRTAPDGNLALDDFRVQLELKRTAAEEAFDIYEKSPITLGVLARQLGTNIIDLVRAWPGSGPKLEVTEVTRLDILKRCESFNEGPWVLDLTFLTELALLGQLGVLKKFPKSYVAQITAEVIYRRLAETRSFRKSGTLFTHEGKLGFHEITELEWAWEREFLQSMQRAVEEHCILMPAYGPSESSSTLRKMNGVLSGEEYSALLLCLQLNAKLLAFDFRLRNVASLLEIQSGSVQNFLLYARTGDLITGRTYSRAVLQMIVNRRSFVSIRALDLLTLIVMDGNYITTGLNALRDYLADASCEFRSTSAVVIEFLALLYLRGQCQFGSIVELTELLLEALLRHPNAPPRWADEFAINLTRAIGLSQRSSQAIIRACDRASKRSIGPTQQIKQKFAVLYCSKIPTVVSGLGR